MYIIISVLITVLITVLYIFVFSGSGSDSDSDSDPEPEPTQTPINTPINTPTLAPLCSQIIIPFPERTPMSNQHFTKLTLIDAVNLWYSNKEEALARYGDISCWDVSQVNDMENLFMHRSFNDDDISNWNVSNVENMKGNITLVR